MTRFINIELKSFACWIVVAFVVTLCAVGEGSEGLRYGKPGNADVVVDHEGFAVGFCIGHRQPAWVAYNLTKSNVETVVAFRSANFFQDRNCCPGLIASLDFSKIGCDIGHMASAADMHWSDNAMRESFMFSNASPQYPQFNRRVWLDLERYVRGFACSEESVFVITGPVLPRSPNISGEVGKRLTIPSHFYKVIYAEKAQKMIGFLVPHKKDLVNVKPFACSVDKVEQATGLDFFSNVPKEIQDKLEAKCDPASWKWEKRDK